MQNTIFMNSTFWTNTIWYIVLALISAAALAVILVKTRERRKTMAFWLAVLGFTYFIEIPLLLLFSAYTYHPMLAPQPFFDAILGNVFSQVSVSTSALLICVLGLSIWWLAGFSAAYFLIDVLYVHLGVYEHFWYRSVYTLGGFFIYGMIVKYWYRKMFGVSSKRVYIPTHYLGIWAIAGNLFGTLFKLINLREFHSGLYADPARDHNATGIIYSTVMVAVMLALHGWRAPLRKKLPVFLVLLACVFGLIYWQVIITAPGWQIPVALIDVAGYYGFTVYLDRLLRSGDSRACVTLQNN